MAVLDLLNTAVNPDAEQVSLASVSSMREAFENWLTDGNAKKYSPDVVLSCLDRISEYSIRKKISSISIWRYTQFSVFQSMYNKLLGAKLLRITERNTYKVFVVAGQLYLRFLKEKPFARKAAISAVVEDKGVESTIVSGPSSQGAINPETVIAWLVTQPNANGTLYLENVVRQYMSALRSAPAKLEIPVGLVDRSVFSCHTPEELTSCWDIFKAAPNYKQVNGTTSGMFSAGMGCLLRYLQHLSKFTSRVEKTDEPDVIQLVENLGLDYVDKRNSGGALWVIGGRELAAVMMKLRGSGFQFLFKEGGGRSSDYKDAWWYKPADSHSTYAAAAVLTNPALEPTVIEKLTDILSSHFANGYRMNSPIELARFRSFAAEDLDVEISLPDEELKSYISACGTTYDGKIYAVSVEAKERIKELVDEYFSDGAQAIFFAEFYAKNENWLFGASVVSEDMLTGILRGLFPKLSFTQTYFGYTDASVLTALESEILRVWGDDVLLTYEQLAERLQYIPFERIKCALGQNGNFIWSRVETFSHISRIDISDEEREIIREAAVQECNARGYTSITDLPFGEIEERNYELSVTAVHNAVFRICLSDKFDKSGKIVTRKGDILDALTIMKDYCRTIKKCSLDDLLNYEKELTGEVHRWIPMEAGNTVLVRIDKDTYVADKFVHFDAETVDAAIELFIEGDYLPLKSFTTFGAFPDCGQAWNLFLLESYCRRFSNSFRFDTPSVNSRNAGAIIRKNCGLNYTEIMTDAVANADVPLTDSIVGSFLFDAGYTGRRTTSKINEIIDKAKALRERRG
ncbi:hypothetical protein B1778_01150 [Dehalococcoides mccartyi]|uniref:hypothetical protein n=1 Tax=Dehalococcoides mccartyi TaxID=61435 RepID=UPI00098E95D5|nr:hypothetical protein [Dehalococcoides mccartyi]AQU05374.1 hypothetical protein B1777_01295 [Dehalococcoides mccartyi]AQU06827.1 hypothetical protein B1778_01150 [Dehalococcoides mccartyi]